MGFLKRLSQILSAGESGPEAGHQVYARCRRCGEVLSTHINLKNDLSLSEDEQGYIVRKTLVGSGLCFERLEVELTFDGNRRLTGREIQGGEFITAEEYQAGKAEA